MSSLAGRKRALNPTVVYCTDRSKAVVLVLILLFVTLRCILRGDLFYVLPCVILFLCFSVLLALRLPRLGKRVLILVLFVRLLDLRLFWFLSVFSSSWCLGRAAVCDRGTVWTFLLHYFQCYQSDDSRHSHQQKQRILDSIPTMMPFISKTKQQWTVNSALRHTTQNRFPLQFCTIDYNLLLPIAQK